MPAGLRTTATSGSRWTTSSARRRSSAAPLRISTRSPPASRRAGSNAAVPSIQTRPLRQSSRAWLQDMPRAQLAHQGRERQARLLLRHRVVAL